MTPEPNLPLRARVAELLGWVNLIRPFDPEWQFLTRNEREKANGKTVGRNIEIYPDGLHHPVPPYDTSRDTVMEAVRVMVGENRSMQATFGEHLERIMALNRKWKEYWPDHDSYYWGAVATPAEICEALLATMGKETAQ